MKKIMPLAASIALILIAGMFAGAGTIAYFSDTENAGNPGFRAKILDIRVHSFKLLAKFAPGEKTCNRIEVEVPSYSMKPDHIEFRLWADLSTFHDDPCESGGTNRPYLLLRYIRFGDIKGTCIDWNCHDCVSWYNYADENKGYGGSYAVSGNGLSMEEGYDPNTGKYWLWASIPSGQVPDPGRSGTLKLWVCFDPDAPNALQGDSIVLHLDVAADQVAGQNQLKCAP